MNFGQLVYRIKLIYNDITFIYITNINMFGFV